LGRHSSRGAIFPLDSVNADVDFAAVTVGNLVFLHGILRNLGFNTIQVLIGLLF
jgi:hypothetical protein